MRPYQSSFRSRALAKKNPTIDLGNTDAFPELGASKVDPIDPIVPIDPNTLWKTTLNEPPSTTPTLANKNWSRGVVDNTPTESPGWIVLTRADTYNRSTRKDKPNATYDMNCRNKDDEEGEGEGEGEDTHESIHAGFQRMVNIHKQYVAEFIETHGYEYYAQNYLSHDATYHLTQNRRITGYEENDDGTYVDDDDESCDEDW